MSHNDETIEKLARIERQLEEIKLWIKVGNLRFLREMLLQELNSKERILIFELTDGVHTQQEVAAQVGVSRSMVSYYWQKWQGLGIVMKTSRLGRMKKIISLEEIGILTTRESGKQKELEVSFQPQDLRRVLSSWEMFPISEELEDLASSILPSFEKRNISLSREDLVNSILKAFEKSDNLKRALFMQALERKASLKGDTQFKKYFEEWERHIGE